MLLIIVVSRLFIFVFFDPHGLLQGIHILHALLSLLFHLFGRFLQISLNVLMGPLPNLSKPRIIRRHLVLKCLCLLRLYELLYEWAMILLLHKLPLYLLFIHSLMILMILFLMVYDPFDVEKLGIKQLLLITFFHFIINFNYFSSFRLRLIIKLLYLTFLRLI